MARKRYTIDAQGRLIDRDGAVIGKLVSLTVDLSDDVIASGARGGAVDSSSTASASDSSPDAQVSLLPQGGVGGDPHQASDVDVVWAHYQRVVPGGNRYTLDEKRRQIIRNALAVRPLEVVLDAITGLSKSSHHLGQNDRRKRYLGIAYALAGRDKESNDERIDKMAEKARTTVADFLANLPSAGREMVRDHMNKVAASLTHPDDANLRARAEGSETYLASTFGLRPTLTNGAVVWSISAT